MGKRLSSMASATFAADADGVRRRGRAGSQLVFAGDGFDAGFGAGDDGVLNEGDAWRCELDWPSSDLIHCSAWTEYHQTLAAAHPEERARA